MWRLFRIVWTSVEAARLVRKLHSGSIPQNIGFVSNRGNFGSFINFKSVKHSPISILVYVGMAHLPKDELARNEDVVMGEASGVSSPKELKNLLYARCASQEENHVFDQRELLSFHIIPNDDVAQLLVHTRQLAKEGLFKLMTKDGKACWKVVKRDDAAKCVVCFSILVEKH